MSAAEEIYASFLRRIEQGESLDLNQLCERHPQLANSLRRLHQHKETVILPSSAATPEARQDNPGSECEPTSDNEGYPDETLQFRETAAASRQIVARYENAKCYGVTGEIDRGGMGVILRVWDENLKRELAMKVIRGQEKLGDQSTPSASAALMARFVREAEITGQLDHPGVVPVHEIGNDEQGRQFFTMRLIRGESLGVVNQHLRAKRGNWTQTRVLEVIVKVCDTLAYAHSKGVIHRDLKPMNIMVGQFGETYVMDWGLAKVIGEQDFAHGRSEPNSVEVTTDTVSIHHSGLGLSDATLDGSVIGTPSYMPPEQASGKINALDRRSDIYSVGTMLYELLANVKPYGDDKTIAPTQKILKAVLAGPPTPIAQLNPKVPSELVAICERAMERSQEDRYASMGEMAEDRRAYLENRVVRAHKTGAFAEFRKWVRRNRGAALASAVAFVFLLAGLSAVIGVQRWNNDKIAAEKDAKQAAFLKEQEARQLAEERGRFVEGLLLASQSKEVLSQDKPTAAILLALESIDRISSHEANNVLLAALDQHSEERMLSGHESRVTSAVYSPDGKSILTASDDHTAAIWDATSGQRKGLLVGHQNFVVAAAFNHDGQRAVTASYDSTGAIWDVGTGRRLHVLPHDQPVLAVQFSLDGALVATAGFDNQAHIWDAESGALLRTLAGHSDYISSVSFSGDGKKLVTASADMTARIWIVDSGESIAVLEGHRQSLSTAQFSWDGQQVVTAGSVNEQPTDGVAQLWDAETGELKAILDTGTAATSAAFASDGDWVAVGSGDGTVRIWDIRQQAFTKKLEGDPGWITRVSFSPDSRSLLAVTSSNSVITWDTQTGARQATMLGHSDSIGSAQFSPDGTRLVTASRDGSARIWRTDRRLVMPQFRHTDMVASAKLFQDRMVTLVGKQRVPHLWSIGDGRLVATLPHSQPVSFALGFSRDGDLLLTSAADGHAYLWSAHNGELLRTLHNTGKVSTVVFAQDGQTVLLASLDENVVSKWNIKTGECELLQRIEFSGTTQQFPGPHGRYFVAIGEQFNLQLLDMDTGETKWEFEANEQLVNAQFSPDGKILRTVRLDDGLVELWQVATGKKLSTLDVGGEIGIALFAPQGESLLAATRDDRFLRRFSVSTGAQLETLAAADGSIDMVVVSPDGTRLVTQATDNTTRLWNQRTGDAICLLGSETRIDVIRFSNDSQYLLTDARLTMAAAATAQSAESSVSIWEASRGALLSKVSDNGLMLGDSFTPDGKWIVSLPRDQKNNVRFWPVDPAALARRFTTRTLTTEERELYQVGTQDERNAFRRQAALDSIFAKLTWLTRHTSLRSMDTSKPKVQARIRPFVDGTLNKLLVELGSEASPAELQTATDHVARLLESERDANPFLLTWLADLFALAGDTIRAIEALERAVQHPAATANIERKLAALRHRVLPDLFSYATIDAVLSQTDASRRDRITKFRQVASGADARLRLRYLDARLAQNQGRFADAVRGYRAVLERQDNHPEPYLRLAECLRARGAFTGAARVLRDALKHPTCRTPDLWNRWAANALADGSESPGDLLKNVLTFPAARQDFGGSQVEHLKWLLRQLADGQAIRINCGGDEYVDAESNIWAADRFFTHGFHFFGGRERFTKDIDNTNADPLYQTERYFDSERKFIPAGYQIPMPAGRYRIKMHFAEIYQPGVRLFDALIEGRTVLKNYDPSETGFATADIKSTNVNVRDGLLNIEFTAAQEAAKISAIEIESLD